MPRKPGSPWKIDISGNVYGRWTVLSRIAGSVWLCRCQCGTERPVMGNMLTLGKSRSCGCLNRETITKHGMEGTSIYNIWAGMKQRCNNPKYHGYLYYGGRGIKVCDDWSSFQNFYRDMGDKPEGKSLDRIDNDGPYSKENCRWATGKQQIRNRKNTVLIDGESAASVAERLGVPVKRLRERIKAGYSGSELLSTGTLPLGRKPQTGPL